MCCNLSWSGEKVCKSSRICCRKMLRNQYYYFHQFSMYLQKSALIQSRTSLSKFADACMHHPPPVISSALVHFTRDCRGSAEISCRLAKSEKNAHACLRDLAAFHGTPTGQVRRKATTRGCCSLSGYTCLSDATPDEKKPAGLPPGLPVEQYPGSASSKVEHIPGSTKSSDAPRRTN